MTALAHHLARLISHTGPISLSQYMALALGHPQHGYYMTRDPLGRRGDFITAPEISQMFGELIGLWLAHEWMAQGRPSRFVLAELGPGRGTLMSDALRATRSVPGFLEASELHLVETSPVLEAEQRSRLPDATWAATWHKDFESLPQAPLYLIANEFFDALPIMQFVKTARGWCERQIVLAEGSTEAAPRFTTALSPIPLPSDDLLPQAMRDAPVDSIAEISPASTAVAASIGMRLRDHGGAALIIDYGYAKTAAGDTLQALRGHGFADPFSNPGEADITAHVDFQTLAAAAEMGGARAYGPIEQSIFLQSLGIGARAQALKLRATEEQRKAIDSAELRLTSADQMGSLFKVLALTAMNAPVPAGFV